METKRIPEQIAQEIKQKTIELNQLIHEGIMTKSIIIEQYRGNPIKMNTIRYSIPHEHKSYIQMKVGVVVKDELYEEYKKLGIFRNNVID